MDRGGEPERAADAAADSTPLRPIDGSALSVAAPQAREGKLSCEAAQPGFVPAIVMADHQNEIVAAPAASGLAASGRIEIMIGGGRRMIVEGDVNPALVVEIVRGLERLA